MSALIETAKAIIRPERNKDNQLVGEKARELWGLLAPDRHPTPQLPTAILRFHFNPDERYHIDERNVRGVNREIKIFDLLLRPYWQTRDDIFELKLHIDPNYFNHGKLDKDDKDSPSFALYINVRSPKQPLDDGYITVFGFAEHPQNKSFSPFKRHHEQHQIHILAESELYSGNVSRVMIGRPDNLQAIRFIAIEDAQTNAEIMLPHNVAWRKKFATDILDQFISDAKLDSPAVRISNDKDWQERSTRQTI